ncbi:hypothetical protein N2W54_005421 [Lotmaria passim]
MSLSRTSVPSRKPIRLPQQTFPPSSISYQPDSTNYTNYPNSTRSHSSGSARRDSRSSTHDGNTAELALHVGAWIDKLQHFTQRYTSTATAAALNVAHHLCDNTVTAFARMSAPPSPSAEAATEETALPVWGTDRAVGDMAWALHGTQSSFAQRLVACTDEFSAAAARVEADEGYFSDSAAVEACVLQHLREWRCYANATANDSDNNNSNNNSRRPSGLYGGGGSDVASAPATTWTSSNTLNSSSSGSPRVQADLEGVRHCTTVMEELHNALAALEDEHRGLQRRYIVEKTAMAEVDALIAQLEELEREEREQQGEVDTLSAAHQPLSSQSRASLQHQQQRRAQRDAAHAKASVREDGKTGAQQQQQQQQQAQAQAAVRASLAACHDMAAQLRLRVSAVAERLTDELLWMRAEVNRHDWSVVRSATALTRMEPVTAVLGGAATAVTTSNGERRRGRVPHTREETDSDERSSGTGDRASRAGSTASSSSLFSHEVEEGRGSRRDSFILRVQVPVFVSTSAPLLPLEDGSGLFFPGSGNGSNAGSGRSSRANALTLDRGSAYDNDSKNNNNSNTERQSLGSAQGLTRRLSANGALPATIAASSTTAMSALSSPNTATVSVVATPARYALVQLYETCREFLAQMLRRLTQLRARRSAEAAQLRRAQEELDVYDPAAEEMTARHSAVTRYLTQLESYVDEVYAVDQSLHERVKLPMDEALQTYERFRAQLLEVLKQRLEQADEEVAAARDASQDTDGQVEKAEDSDGEQQRQQKPQESTEPCHNHDAEQEEEQAEQRAQRWQTPTGSLGEERARRSTQPPPPSAAACELPRASAKFIGMLDTLLKEQQQQQEVSNVAAAAEPDDATADVTVIRMTSHADAPVSKAAAADDDVHDVSSTDKEQAGSSDQLAGHRRLREDEEDDADTQNSNSNTNLRAPSVVNNMAESDTEQNINDTEEAARESSVDACAVVVTDGSKSADEVEDVNADEEDDSDDEDALSQHAESPAHPRQLERRRYGLSSEDGFSGGLRAFFAAVAHRVMDFSSSDDEEKAEERPQKRARHD